MSTRTLLRTSAAVGLAACLFSALPSGATAQRGPPDRGALERQELERRLQRRFGMIVSRQLGLERGDQEALAEILRTVEQHRRELATRETRLRRRLAEQATLRPRAPVRPLPGEAEARRLLRELTELREEETRLYFEERERLLEVLTPPQLVRFYALREQLARAVDRLRQGSGRPGGGGPDAGVGFGRIPGSGPIAPRGQMR